MITRVNSGKQNQFKILTDERIFRPAPLSAAIALALAIGGLGLHAPADAANGAWFARSGAGKEGASNGAFRPVTGIPGRSTQQQQQQSRQQLQRSLDTLGRTASAIAAQQAAQQAARAAAQGESSAPDGYVPGGLWDKDAAGNALAWSGADRPQEIREAGKTTVAINQTSDKAILNWDTFNVGRDTTVQFQQQADWSVLNRVTDPQQRPSQIQGQVRGDGTVMVVNRNGIVFSGSSQVNVRNLVAAAVDMTDAQFGKGIYSDASGSSGSRTFTPSFGNDLTSAGRASNATGDVTVASGAQISTNMADTSTRGGGYVLMLGREVRNAGQIETPNGQALLAAGDSFIIRRGYGSEENQLSTTRGNEVAGRVNTGSLAGAVSNSGLMLARTGDITLTGRTITQQGVAVATTDVNARGTVHLLNSISDTAGSVTVSQGSTTAVLADENAATALDAQWRALSSSTADADRPESASGRAFDNLGRLGDQSNLSRVEIVSGGTVDFEGGSLTLATGGQIAVHAARRSLVRDGADLDVSGAVGVRVAMEANNLLVNVQGNEQRDAPVNRESGALNSSDVWVDRRFLVTVKADYDEKTNPLGYKTDRLYTVGGLLEVSGYAETVGHSVGEWLAQGGSVNFAGSELVTQSGSRINLSGGTLDVQSGYINMTWLRGADGRLYEVSRAPGDLLYSGLYQGYEDTHARWGESATRYYRNPLIAPQRRFESGYTVGRDAGRLLVGTTTAVLEGQLINETFQGDRQIDAPQAGVDGYGQSQTALARHAQLILGRYNPGRVPGATLGADFVPTANHVVIGDLVQDIASGLDLAAELPEERRNALYLNSNALNGVALGSLLVAAKETVRIDGALEVTPGGEIAVRAPQIDVNASLTARSGSIQLGNLLPGSLAEGVTPVDPATVVRVSLAPGVMLDARGLWTNLFQDPLDRHLLPFIDGGTVSLRTSGTVSLGEGSRIDVSSGAAMLADKTLQGGAGGSVTLAGMGDLLLAGDIQGYGVSGAGRLSIESGRAVGIGGEILDQAGILQAGEVAPVDLTALEGFTVRAGEILPGDYSYSRSRALPGEALGGPPLINNTNRIVLAAEWILPISTSTSRTYSLAYLDPITGRQVTRTSIGPNSTIAQRTIPANATIVVMSNAQNFPTNYVVEGNVFPTGFPISPTTVTLKAGQVAPVDVDFAAGTVISAGAVFSQAVAVTPIQILDTRLFQAGFASYSVKSYKGIVVKGDSTLDIVKPVLRAGQNAANVLTDDDPAAALEKWTPPVFLDVPAKGVLSQRSGSSLTLVAEGGTLSVGSGAKVQVDPGQSISLQADRQVDLYGTVVAPGGRIEVAPALTPRQDPVIQPYNVTSAHSIRVHAGAVLDVAGSAVTAQDTLGRVYGTQRDGGSITLDAAPGGFVVIEPGATLDASGSAMAVSALDAGIGSAARLIEVAGNGGTISLLSNAGIYLNGTVRAAAGGAGAAGGTLALSLETPLYDTSQVVPDALRKPSELLIVQQALSPDTMAVPADRELSYGYARLGVDQVAAGGFGGVSLFARDLITFDGDVDLRMAQSIKLYQGSIGNITAGAQVALSAPYVLLSGRTNLAATTLNGSTNATLNTWAPSTQDAAAAFTVNSDLLDIQNVVRFGMAGTVMLNTGSTVIDRRGYAQVSLNSRGDIRFLSPDAQASSSAYVVPDIQAASALISQYDLTLGASRVYPTTGANALVIAGLLGRTSLDPTRVVRFTRTGTTDQAPMSVFGRLDVRAGTIEQGGTLHAPLGRIVLGQVDTTQSVHFLPGSLTSVSANGLVIPYGGTTDDLSYLYNGSAISVAGVGGLNGGLSTGVAQGIAVESKSVVVDQSSVLDLSGGGELTGAAFVSGRGGSTDPLLNALVRYDRNSGAFSLPSLSSNPVYAIVPGYQDAYAPVTPVDQSDSYTGSLPQLGQQISIGAGVPGLAAGTYTLLPSFYALLPGAYRVELGSNVASATPVTALRNGSWLVSGNTSTANTEVQAALPRQITLTSGDVLRQYGQYNETSYRNFIIAEMARTGTPRPILPEDAKALALTFPAGAGQQTSALIVNGDVRFTPAENGYAGQAIVLTQGPGVGLEIVGQAATEAFGGASVRAGDLNALGAARLSIGGWISGYSFNMGVLDNRLSAGSNSGAVTVRGDATLRAAEVALINGDITVEQGARIDTIDQGAAPYDSSQGYIYRSTPSMLMVSNGWLDLPTGGGGGTIRVGVCGTADCSGLAQLYSEGSIVFSSDNAAIGDMARFGTRNLTLAVTGLNIGTEVALAAARANGTLPAGMQLSQSTLTRLLAGDPEQRAPALERLIFSAKDSVNLFGTVDLSTLDPATGKSSLGQLVFNTPAIYGQGAVGDVAKIATDTLVWNGVADPEQAAVRAGGPGTGAGTLSLEAGRILFGYADGVTPSGREDRERLVLGFGTVNLTATDRITANGQGRVSVHQALGAVVGGVQQYSGGNLNLITPLLTGEAGSINHLVAGNALVLTTPADAAVSDNAALGATLTLQGGTVTLGGKIGLASGKLDVQADGDILLGDQARLDVAGREVLLVDQAKYSWGGDVHLESTHGNVAQAAGSTIDLSARFNQAGTLTVSAQDAAAGRIALAGTVLGTATGDYDAGGTMVPYAAGGIALTGQHIDDFSGLNQRLTAGGVTGSRSFRTMQGDLVIGNEIKAREVIVSADGGSLTVNGKIDASGRQVGVIRLAARDNLTLAGTAVLDVHGTDLRVDSYGKIIDAANRAIVDLTSGTDGTGTLTVLPQATIDLRAGTDVAVGSGVGQNDGASRGTVVLNVPRLGSTTASQTGAGAPANATGGDLDIAVASPFTILGADSIAVYGYANYTNAPTGQGGQVVNQDYLDKIDADSKAFIKVAYGNNVAAGVLSAGLQAKLAGLTSYGQAFHLRPGVEIRSATANGNLTVDRDLDLSGYRYGPNAVTSRRGSGEPGALSLRAGGDLAIRGSINDGFAPPPVTPDDGSFAVVDSQGNQTGLRSGKVWAVAPMLAAGSLSWDIRLGAGADLASADRRALQTATQLGGKGNLTLSDLHYMVGTQKPIFSVVRTGTGDLDLLAGGSFSQNSLYGIYTAGTQASPILGDDGTALKDAWGRDAFNQARGYNGSISTNSILPDSRYEYLVKGTNYAAWYPEQGGNVSMVVQGDLTGSIFLGQVLGTSVPTYASSNYVGSWLWRQGGNEVGLATAWWINFGTYVPYQTGTAASAKGVNVEGFTGIGALGGGNLDLRVGGDAGVLRSTGLSDRSSQGLNVAVGSTGRVVNGDLVMTGGGDLRLDVGGALNPGVFASAGGNPLILGSIASDLSGTVTNLRGHLDVRAGSIGYVDPLYGVVDSADSRAVDPLKPSIAISAGGLEVVVGDAVASLATRGDLVLDGVGDPGRYDQRNYLRYQTRMGGGVSWYSLWTGNTQVQLFASGGDLTPFTMQHYSSQTNQFPLSNTSRANQSYPAQFSAVSAQGSIYYMANAGLAGAGQNEVYFAPSLTGQSTLELLAGDSVYGGKFRLLPSGADPASIPTPFHPAFTAYSTAVANTVLSTNTVGGNPYILHAFGLNTIAGSAYVNDPDPIRIYAVTGDLVNVSVGTTVTGSQTAYIASKSVRMQAGRDIVNPNGLFFNNNATDISTLSAGRDILNPVVDIAGPGLLEAGAGRNLYLGNTGRLTSLGLLNGSSDRSGGASIVASAGTGVDSVDYTGFALHYINPANLVDPSQTLASQPGKVVQTYGDELTLAAWLRANHGYTGADDDPDAAQAFLQAAQASLDAANAADASAPRRNLQRDYQQASQLHLVNWLSQRFSNAATPLRFADNGQPIVFDAATMDASAFYQRLPAEQQRVYARNLYYAELRAGGREYNDIDSPRFRSYLRGRTAIAMLFPTYDTGDDMAARIQSGLDPAGVDGNGTSYASQYGAIARSGDLTLFQGTASNGSIRTIGGGDIQLLVPAGRTTIGAEGIVPVTGTNVAPAGLVTQGSGNIQLYSSGSILLGLSRIMTTYGGDITAWSAQGDINAGRGAKTTVVYTPLLRTYDASGNVALSPNVPATGAGVSVQAPVPDVPAGDVDLIAPEGTIDAGEAGIRASGNVNVAALQVVNAANIQAQGDTAGVPVVAAINVGALTAASSAATSAASAAQDAVRASQGAARQSLPSIISVQVLGFGPDGSDSGSGNRPAVTPAPGPQTRARPQYDASLPMRVVGLGANVDASTLTAEEQRLLKQDR